MKKLIYKLGYIVCNRIVLCYGALLFLFWFAINIKSFGFVHGYIVLGVVCLAIIGWCSYLVCALPSIKPNRWEQPMINYIKSLIKEN